MIAIEQSAETKIIIDLLRGVPIGGTITLAAISDAIGRDITACRGYLYTALKRVQNNDGAVFSSVKKIGYRRLPAEEIPMVGKTARDRIRRTAARGSQAIAAGIAGANNLPDDVRLNLHRQQGALNMIAHLARDKQTAAVNVTTTRPPTVAETARSFLSAIGAVRGDGGEV